MTAGAAADGAAPPQPQPLLAQCLAAEVDVGRSNGGHLLAWVPGTQLVVAAAGCHLLLLRATLAAIQPVAQLLVCPSSISAVAVSQHCGGSSGNSSSEAWWAAAVAGREVHLLPFRTAGAASDSCSFEAPTGAAAWQACAWHPSQPLCALLGPQQLLLVSSVNGSSNSSSGGDSSSSDAASSVSNGSEPHQAGAHSTRSAGVLASVPLSASLEAATGRCCLAWVEGTASSGIDEQSGWGNVVVSHGTHLELLAFGSGGALLQRRQLLPGLPGPVCGLAAAGSHRILVATERLVSQWLSSTEQQHPQQIGGQQQEQQQSEGEEDSSPRVLLRGLQWAQQRQQQEMLLLPASRGSNLLMPGPASPAGLEAEAAGQAGQRGSPSSDDSIIDLTRRNYCRSASAPAVPARFLLPLGDSRDGLSQAHMPLEAGLPALPLHPSHWQGGSGGLPAQGGHGQAALLWLGESVEASSRGHSGAEEGSSGAAAAPCAAESPRSCGSPRPPADAVVGGLASAALGTGGGPASPPAATVASPQPLEFAPNLLQVQSGLALLASSKSSAPALALCRLDLQELQQQGATVRLALPASSIPDGSAAVRIRGLAMLPEAHATEAGAAGGRLAAATSAGDGALVCALLAVAPRAVSAPFLSSALGSSGKQQLWLCCYRLAHLLQASAVAAAGESSAVADRAEAEGQGSGDAASQQLVGVPPRLQINSTNGAASTTAAAAPQGSAAEAVVALQGEVAALRLEINARLDGVEAQLGQLLRALQPP